ncbi:MAG: flavin reductase family protein [Albidovulum sp.]|nr:flavin reductase family protein [Albidovulum sp.]
MFYKPSKGHRLPHNPFNAIVAPRPIGWISTRGSTGSDNLAPYSFFNAVAYSPPQVMFATTGGKSDRARGKDSLANIIETEVFCTNLVEYSMREKMNLTSGSYGRDIDEFEFAGIDRRECETISCCRVANAPANLECRLTKVVTLAGDDNSVVFGEVVGVHLRDDCIRNGKFDLLSCRPVARLGYHDYCRVDEAFSMLRPA